MLCRVLRSEEELVAARHEYRSRRLCPPTDSRKAWDNLIALEALKHVAPDESIVDVGCRSGILLTWLDQIGYRRLWGCDVKRPLPAFKQAVRRGYATTFMRGAVMYVRHRQRMRRTPAENTTFPKNEFAAVTAMSVIEHAVDTRAFFGEAMRLLRPGGVLFLSTDYWREPLVTAAGDRVFGPEDVDCLVREATSVGLRPLCEPERDVAEAVIAEGGLRYTFLTMGFEHPAM